MDETIKVLQTDDQTHFAVECLYKFKVLQTDDLTHFAFECFL